MPQFSIATFLIVSSVSFFLGILFSQFPYDYPLLWSSAPSSQAHMDQVETHLKLLFHAPNLIVRMLHIMIATGLLGLVIKLYKPSESNLLFDGGSLLLYMIAAIVYLTNVVKGLRIVDYGSYGTINLKELTPEEKLVKVNELGMDPESGEHILGREDNLKILAASNTILALVLVGVLVLQIGQWYAERSDEKAMKEFLAKQAQDKAAGSSSSNARPSSSASSSSNTATTTATDAASPNTASVKRQGSAKEGKKAK